MEEKVTKKKTRKKKSSATKQLEQENMALKQKLQEVLNFAKDLEKKKSGGDLTHNAIGCSRNEKGEFVLDYILYNPESKEAIVDKQELLKPNPKSYHSLMLNLGKIGELDISKNVDEKE